LNAPTEDAGRQHDACVASLTPDTDADKRKML
jgi:hypothetical protein